MPAHHGMGRPTPCRYLGWPPPGGRAGLGQERQVAATAEWEGGFDLQSAGRLGSLRRAWSKGKRPRAEPKLDLQLPARFGDSYDLRMRQRSGKTSTHRSEVTGFDGFDLAMAHHQGIAGELSPEQGRGLVGIQCSEGLGELGGEGVDLVACGKLGTLH